MNVHLYSFPHDTRKLCVRFDLPMLLPVQDWLKLFELAEKDRQSLPTYIVGLLKAHIQQPRGQNTEGLGGGKDV